MSDVSRSSEPVEPTDPGFYIYSGGRQTMVFLLDLDQTWYVIFDNVILEHCVWDYIAQALSVWDLVPLRLLASQA